MQRRRKKTAKHSASRHKYREPPSNNTMLLDKSLPKLPPSAVDRKVLSPDVDSLPSDGTSDTPTELPRISQKKPGNSRSSSYSSAATEGVPRPSQKRSANSRSSSSKSGKRERSPPAPEEDQKGMTD